MRRSSGTANLGINGSTGGAFAATRDGNEDEDDDDDDEDEDEDEDEEGDDDEDDSDKDVDGGAMPRSTSASNGTASRCSDRAVLDCPSSIAFATSPLLLLLVISPKFVMP